jgi:hypothetical protein
MPPLPDDFPIVLLVPRCFDDLLKLLFAELKFVTFNNKLSDDVLLVNDNFSVVSSRGELVGELVTAPRWIVVVVCVVVVTIIAEVC